MSLPVLQLSIALGAGFLVVLLCCTLTTGTPTATTLAGGIAALDHIVEGAKWMSGIQTAALGLLSILVFKENSVSFRPVEPFAQGAATAAFLYLGAALLCNAWVLSSIPSLTVRLHAVLSETRSQEFDVYELPVYGWMGAKRERKLPALLQVDRWPSLTMAVLMTIQHWLWAIGLLALAALLLSLLFNPIPDTLAKG